jgi:hypothetical protein
VTTMLHAVRGAFAKGAHRGVHVRLTPHHPGDHP